MVSLDDEQDIRNLIAEAEYAVRTLSRLGKSQQATDLARMIARVLRVSEKEYFKYLNEL